MAHRTTLSLLAALSIGLGLAVANLSAPWNLGAILFSVMAGWFTYRSIAKPSTKDDVLILGGVRWNEEDFCRGWQIDGRTGSGKTSSGVIPIIHQIKKRRPDIGILALDTKGDLGEPLAAVAQYLGCSDDLRQIQVRPDHAPADWKPPYTMNFLADTSIPYSTYAKILVDVATAAGQKGGQAFFKNAAQVAIQNALSALALLDYPVTLDNCFQAITDLEELQRLPAKLEALGAENAKPLADYFKGLIKQPPEQLGGVRSTVFNYLQPYTLPDIAEVFCPLEPNFDLKEIDEGRLISVRIPQKFQSERRYVSLLLKVLFYIHTLRRYDLPTSERASKNLIVMVLDEAQETVLVSEDGISDFNVIDKIRGARATVIFSSQSPTSYIPPMGARDKAEVFLLNLGNKIHFTAADKQASEMIADSIGKRTIKKRTYSFTGGKRTVSWTEQDEHLIKPHVLRALPKHTAVLKHCEQGHRRMPLRPISFTR